MLEAYGAFNDVVLEVAVSCNQPVVIWDFEWVIIIVI